ncbi:MAG: hypothetical protein ACTSR3_00280 [Candidatus Helarchaeota archaeon]
MIINDLIKRRIYSETAELKEVTTKFTLHYLNFLKNLKYKKFWKNKKQEILDFLSLLLACKNTIESKDNGEKSVPVHDIYRGVIEKYMAENAKIIGPFIFKLIQEKFYSTNSLEVNQIIKILRTRQKFTEDESNIIIKAMTIHFVSSNKELKETLSEFSMYFQNLLSPENQDLFNKRIISMVTENFSQL